MSSDAGATNTPLTPEDAFSAIGNETRVEILQALAETDQGLSFSELRERVGMRDSGQFNYHLDKLVGHFVEKTEETYTLRMAGRRVIEAVLSGAVTADPVIEPTEIDRPCPYCGAETRMSYNQEFLGHSCTECAGEISGSVRTYLLPDDMEEGYLGGYALPPAGIQGRTPAGVLSTARTWTTHGILTTARNICPRCSAPVDRSVDVCEAHAGTDGLCEECGLRHGVTVQVDCENCVYRTTTLFVDHLLTDTTVLQFLTARDLNPHDPGPELDRVLRNHDEEIVSADPFEGRFTFAVDGDALTLTVDDELSVVDASRHEEAETT